MFEAPCWAFYAFKPSPLLTNCILSQWWRWWWKLPWYIFDAWWINDESRSIHIHLITAGGLEGLFVFFSWKSVRSSFPPSSLLLLTNYHFVAISFVAFSCRPDFGQTMSLDRVWTQKHLGGGCHEVPVYFIIFLFTICKRKSWYCWIFRNWERVNLWKG